MHIVLDPSTGDEIMAKGTGRIQLEIPANNDMRINGQYIIDDGYYTYTYKKLQLRLTRMFNLNPGGTIGFNGPFSETTVNVDATYRAKARLIDLLTDPNIVTGSEKTDAQTPQWVDVLLHMKGLLNKPELTFDIALEDTHSQGTLADRQLTLINNDPQQKLTEVSALLILNTFVSPDGIGGSAIQSGSINTLGEVISSSTSAKLTGLINKLAGNQQWNVAVKYTNYNYSDPTTTSLGAVNRNQVNVGLSYNLLNNRLTVEGGTTSDWGQANSTSTNTNFNLTGDFRIQYQISENSGMRLSVFRTSDYDVTLDRDIERTGAGIGWRKSFDNFDEFFRGNKYAAKQKEKSILSAKTSQTDTTGKKTGGTN